MASSSSSHSSITELLEQRKQLTMEQQTLQREIQRLRLSAEGCEHDLQMSRTAFSFAESTIIGRTKKLADLFGGRLRSDEELVDRIQGLIQSAERNEALSIELQQQIDHHQRLSQNDDNRLDHAGALLRRQKRLSAAKSQELQAKQEQLEAITDLYNEAQLKRVVLVEKFTPLTRLVNSILTIRNCLKRFWTGTAV
jgi:hypothetical protein